MSNAKHGNGARWLRSLSRAWVVASLVLLVGFSVLGAATPRNSLVCIATAVIAVAAYYTVALLLLRHEGQVKTGLALLVAGGLPASATIFFAIVLGTDQDSFDHWGAAVAALFAIAQVGMIASAIATYYAGNRAAGDRSLLARCFIVAVAMFGGLTCFVLPFLGFVRDSGRKLNNENSALKAMQTINMAEVTFASTYNSGFSDTLRRLGAPATGQPDVNNADLLDPVLAANAPGNTDATAFVRDGYKIVYTPGPGKFGWIGAFTLVARPVQYGVTGTTSYYLEETMDAKTRIRATTENRAATANDPDPYLAADRRGGHPAAIVLGTLFLACVAFYLCSCTK